MSHNHNTSPCGCNKPKPCGCSKPKPCGCEEPQKCGCDFKLDLLCAFYSGVNLLPLGITPGMDGNTVIKIINDYIKDLEENLELDPTVIDNVGNGVKLYKGLSEEFKHEVRTLLQGEGIMIREVVNLNEDDEPYSNEVEISLDKDWFDTNYSVDLNNIGSGEKLLIENSENNYSVKSLKSSDSTVTITSDASEVDFKVVIPEPPVIESEDLGNGISLRASLNSKKIPISTLKSDSFIITKEEDGSVKINSPGGGSNSSDWYIDPYFVRPSNWNTSQNPKEQITYLSSMNMIDPTVYTNGQSVPVPSGKLNDPFKTYEEYLLKRIYGAGTGLPGPYSKVNPAYPSVTIQILNPLHTASDIEVVNTTYHLKNGSPLTYEGSREYAIDNAELFDNMPLEGGKIKFTSQCDIRGEGSIRRTTGFGLLRHKTDKVKTNSTNHHMLNITGEGNGLYFIEGENNSLYHVITKEDGVTQLTNGNSPCMGTTQAPVTPLISIEGTNSGYWSAIVNGTKIFINIKTQIGIYCFNEGCISSGVDNFMFQVNNQRIGYQKRLYGDGVNNIMPGITLEEQEIVNHSYNPNNTNGYVFYLPHPDFCVFKGDNTSPGLSAFRIEKISTEANGFNNAGADSIFKLKNSQIINQTSYKDMGGGCALNLLKLEGVNDIIITNGTLLPSYFNMVKGVTGGENVIVSFINSSIYPKNIKENLTSLTISTGGTISSIKNTPIMGQLPEYPNNGAALEDLLPGSLYKDSTTKEVKQVV